GHLGGRQGPAHGAARERDHGLGLRLRRRRRAPAHARDHPEPAVGGRRGRQHLVHARARADLARHPGHLDGPARPRRLGRGCARRLGGRLRGGALRAGVAGGLLPALERHDGGQHGPHGGRGGRERRTGGRRLGDRQPRQGHRGRRDPVGQHRARPARAPGPDGERGRPVSVTAAAGFTAAGVAAGLKGFGKRDLALVVNEGPLRSAAAVFTSNRAKANPILWSQQVIADGTVSAIVLNSGGANCFTGPEGFQTTHATAEAVGEALGVSAGDVLVCSTGLIGEQLDREKIVAGAHAAAVERNEHGGAHAAEAIMTTDTTPKTATVSRDGWTIGGMAKGAGMLAPGLATMLVVLTTDAVLLPAELDRMLRAATRVSFDRLDSDGCMSTNDQVTLLASGASGIEPEPGAFQAALTQLC